MLLTLCLALLIATLQTTTAQQTTANSDACWTAIPSSHSTFPYGLKRYNYAAVSTLESCKLVCWSDPACFSIDWTSDVFGEVSCWTFSKDAPTVAAGSSLTHYTLNRTCSFRLLCLPIVADLPIYLSDSSTSSLVKTVTNTVTVHYPPTRPISTTASPSSSVTSTQHSSCDGCCDLRPTDLPMDTGAIIDRLAAGIGIGVGGFVFGAVVATSVAIVVEVIRRRERSSSGMLSSAAVTNDGIYEEPPLNEDPRYTSLPPATVVVSADNNASNENNDEQQNNNSLSQKSLLPSRPRSVSRSISLPHKSVVSLD